MTKDIFKIRRLDSNRFQLYETKSNVVIGEYDSWKSASLASLQMKKLGFEGWTPEYFLQRAGPSI